MVQRDSEDAAEGVCEMVADNVAERVGGVGGVDWSCRSAGSVVIGSRSIPGGSALNR